MNEVPEGLNLPAFARKPPRPSVTLTLTRDGDDGVEVLLGRRSETMRAFPGYWAFPGGGVSRSDKEAQTHDSIMIIMNEANAYFAQGRDGFRSGQGSMPSASASATNAASCSSSSSTEDANMFLPRFPLKKLRLNS